MRHLKMRRKAVTFKRPSPLVNAGLLGKRTRSEREIYISLLERAELEPQVREIYAAKLLLDFDKMEQDHQDRFGAVMQNGSPDERRRIACAVARRA